jgi:aspartate-semialdehyde dehydrogenase
MPSQPLNVAVVGATGVVGRTMVKVLAERGFPVAELCLLASGRSAGKTIEIDGHAHWIGEATPDAFEGVDIALFSAGGDVSKTLAPEAAKRGATVIDNSSAWRMDDDVPLVVSQVNPDDLAWHEGIIANPNCSTMQLVPLLMALRDRVGIERVVVDTYQSVSGTGSDAITELEGQVRAWTEGEELPRSVYPHQIAFNALPEIDVFLPNGYTKEEWKVVTESRKILHLPDLRVSCTAVRIPVFVSHSEAVHVETRDALTPEQARELFAQVPGVVVRDDPSQHEYPLAIDAAGTDDIYVGRVRQDLSIPGDRGLAFWVVSDNVRKGAATNAVEIAEALIARDEVRARSRRGEAMVGAGAGGGTASRRRFARAPGAASMRRGRTPSPVRATRTPRSCSWARDPASTRTVSGVRSSGVRATCSSSSSEASAGPATRSSSRTS